MITKFLLTFTMTFFAVTPPTFAATSATTEATSTITPIPSTTTSINPSAQAGKSSQSSGAAMNMAAAAMMMAACMASTPPNMALCMMGAMAAMQGAADKDAANQSGTTQAATDTSGASGSNGTTASVTNPSAVAGSATFDQQSKINAGLATLKDAGYTATPAGISSASGTVPASAFSSSGSMLAAGLDPAAVKEAEKIGKEVVSKYTTMSMAADAGGGSGGGDSGSGGDSSTSSSIDPNAYKNPFALGQAKKTELMAGKTVQFDGEPIGVKGDDIFQMIHAAYDKKRAGAHFIETDHDPQLSAVSVRAPASVIKPASVNSPPTLQRLALPKK